MATAIENYAPTNTYIALVNDFKLAHIRDAAHLAAALGVVDGLLCCELDEGGREYLGALTDLIEVYENATIPSPTAAVHEVIRALVEGSDRSQAELADELDISQSTISALVRGQRAPTSEHIAVLSKRFGVSPRLLLPR
ncbi:helix-turn-helix domain-containing protein [Isosphaeraceae bacterium EP7]